MLNRKQFRNGLVDAALLIAFLAEFYMSLTGVNLHQWLGIVIGLGAGYHLVTHWSWVEAVVGRFFKALPGQARWCAVLDAALLFGLVLIIETGIIMSTWLNLSLANYAAWSAVHTAASVTTLVLLAAKLVLHWRWIVKTIVSAFGQASGAPKTSSAPALAAVQAATAPRPQLSLQRRHFLSVAGLTSLAALVSIQQVLANSPQSAATTASSASTASDPTSSLSGSSVSSATNSSAASSAATTCQVRCNRRCSFPGSCRRYTDSNGNNRCDLGECA